MRTNRSVAHAVQSLGSHVEKRRVPMALLNAAIADVTAQGSSGWHKTALSNDDTAESVQLGQITPIEPMALR